MGLDISGLDHVSRWLSHARARPASQRGTAVPVRIPNAIEDERVGDAFVKNASTFVTR